MIRAIIIDDEDAGIEILKILASRNASRIRVIASSTDAEEGIRMIENYQPDVVFLDISMPGMSGFELLSRLTARNFRLIFTTAHREYALQAIKQKAFDYLLKPVADADFRKCLDDLVKNGEAPAHVRPDPNLFIEIQVKDGVLYLKQNDIIRLEAARSYTEFHMDNGIKHIASKSLKDFEQKLDDRTFYRCHKSHIINLHKVQRFINHDGFYAMMSNGSTPDISKTHKDEFLERLKAL